MTEGAVAPRYRIPSRAGGGVTLLLAAILLAGLTAWLWIRPIWQREQRAENERSAYAVIHHLSNLEAWIRSQDLDGNGALDFWTGDVAGLLAMIPANLRASRNLTPDFVAALSQADPARPGAQPYLGYWFVPIATDEMGKPYRQNGRNFHPNAFGWCAYPARYGVSGHSTSIINEGNSPFKRDTQGAPVPSRPAYECLKQEWAKYQ